ncbi:hypothetical protein [Altererythrobacter sp. Root672]|uniref:hypothetical protein n=1 Tax=Altererythrobacter sp. Root672 TaxID=1736584 RepID=UPI000AEEC751|nr:hypothetical protein [Altererythrobacter sp. Root672]
MNSYRNALCWAGAIVGVALAGMFEVIDQASTTTLLIALPVAGWMAVSGRGACPLARKG